MLSSCRYDNEIRSSLLYVLDRCYLGDWFVLQQLSRNVNVYFFREFIKELRAEMKGSPKRHMRDKSFSISPDRSAAAQTAKELKRAASETPGADLKGAEADNNDGDGQNQEKKEKSQYLLRIEHEQRLMPHMRGRRGRGRVSR